ncbi:DNA-binding transcriptional LysR family regulator [Microterricola gilva]|uniref:DNA-binding transcriptional LysR family regulator n=1 Tax=Microterricola gilva TaxID=393267 RepID=A0A4Q8AMJ5_9MICO|nr:LysR family transcriptional regulator [Microterricola gilva]RZU65787.1 DNA-binding transcriptional LysR family regulator [Microterricola gilva]
MLDVRKLRMLAELDRLGTIAAVASSLHLTGPAVSMQLAALERELGVQLTEKRGRRLALTPAGALLAEHGRSIAGMLSLAEIDVRSVKDGVAGHYRIAAFPSSARTIVAALWRRLRESDGLGITIELVEMEPDAALPALAAGEVDLAIAHAYSNLPEQGGVELSAEPIAREPVWLAQRVEGGVSGARAGGVAQATGPTVDLADFAHADWLMPHAAWSWSCAEMVQRACGLAGFEPRAVAVASDFSVLLALVDAGAGVALVPQLTVAHRPAGVSLHPLASPVYRTDFVVSRASSAADAGLATLRRLIAECAVELLPAPVRAGGGVRRR